jgi:ferric-dicitrate binding protein FerR (iron transport regulator)
MDEDRTKQLLMGLMDGELTDDETREINEMLRRNRNLRDEYEQLREVNGTLKVLSETFIDENYLRQVWRSPFRRLLRGISYLMIGVSFLVLVVIGLEEYLAHGNGNFLTKVCTSGILVGVIILFLQVIRDRVIVYKKDPYKDIEK